MRLLLLVLSISCAFAQLNDTATVPDQNTLEAVWKQEENKYAHLEPVEAGNMTVGGWDQTAARR